MQIEIETIDDSQFKELAAAAFDRIEDALEKAFDENDLDVDIERQGSSVLNIKFPNKTVIVVNMQTPLHELWVAAKEGGFHYRWAGTEAQPSWVDTKSGAELFTELSRMATAQAQTPLSIRWD